MEDREANSLTSGTLSREVLENRLARARKLFRAGAVITHAGLISALAGFAFGHPHFVDEPSVIGTLLATAAGNKLITGGMVIEWIGLVPAMIGRNRRDKAKKALGLL
jgi:hypothetical protein